MKFNDCVIPVVWVDLDDTIIDFTTNAHLALCAMWIDEPILRKLFATPDLWATSYEKYNMALWAQYNKAEITREYLRLERFRRPLTNAGLEDNEAVKLAHRYDTLYLDYLAKQKTLMPGALEFMKWLRRQNVVIGCLSNGFREVQFRKIHRAGLDDYFDLVVLSDDIGINKPDPRIYQYAMQRVGIEDPSAHLMIGDNPDTDISGALSASWHAIWYRPTRSSLQPSSPLPSSVPVVSSLTDIPQLFQ